MDRPRLAREALLQMPEGGRVGRQENLDQEGVAMRVFEDQDGREWRVAVSGEVGPEYKGRYHLTMEPVDGGAPGRVELLDIRWNSERTARRTFETMSLVELRRRLRNAAGRSATAV